MSSPRYILHDIPNEPTDGSGPVCWSPNVWKARLVLNLKNIDYETRWVEFPDIEERVGKALALPPLRDQPWHYTLPVLTTPSGASIMDSLRIASHLDHAHPSPFPLRTTSPAATRIDALVTRASRALFPITCVAITQQLSERSRAYYERSRGALFGKTLEEVRREMGGEEAWEAVGTAMRELGEEVRASEGVFAEGSEPSWADVLVVSMLQANKALGEEFFDRIVGYDSALGELHDAFGKWLGRRT